MDGVVVELNVWFAGPRLGRALPLCVGGDSQVCHRICCESGLLAVRREHQDDRRVYSLLLPREPSRNRPGHHFTPYQRPRGRKH